ncbi:unnamed protein product [Rotaria sordida]|uniref:Uncharacterized protein n=1 Tax=Rotaria sordida TaxID=392033 RepID=A0A819JD26_9BILA|nr:unnamed protein product [Rotaria sordida]
MTSCINLQLFDEPKKDQLDDNDNEQSEINGNILSTDNNDTFSFRDHHNTTRDIFTRRRALDPIEQYDLKTYIHHRKNSIVQHVIGYDYDDNSIVGGLYTRVGIRIFIDANVIFET